MGFGIINQLKKEKGLTNAQLATASGITLSTIDKITAGINTNPKLDTLQAICGVLGCKLDDFDNKNKTKTSRTTGYSQKEDDLIKKYRALDRHGIKIIDLLLNTEYERVLVYQQETTKDTDDHRIDAFGVVIGKI